MTAGKIKNFWVLAILTVPMKIRTEIAINKKIDFDSKKRKNLLSLKTIDLSILLRNIFDNILRQCPI